MNGNSPYQQCWQKEEGRDLSRYTSVTFSLRTPNKIDYDNVIVVSCVGSVLMTPRLFVITNIIGKFLLHFFGYYTGHFFG